MMLSTISIAMPDRECECPLRRPVAGELVASFGYELERIDDIGR